jgi:Spy/CpxP family protein refolding chaperone
MPSTATAGATQVRGGKQMKTRILLLIGGLALALGLAVVVIPAAAAAGRGFGAGDGTGPIVGAAFGPGPGAGMRNGVGHMDDQADVATGREHSLVAIAAQKLTMSQTDLAAELRTGKSIAQVANERKVDVNTIVDAVVADRTAQINARVAAGALTQAQADQVLAQLRGHVTEQVNGVWTAGMAGPHGGMGNGGADCPYRD